MNKFVSVAMRRNLMTLLREIFHQSRMPFCNPTKNEKGGLSRMLRQQIGDFPGVVLDPAPQLIPLASSRN